MDEHDDEIPPHPDGLSFPEGGIQTREGPKGHQRVIGDGARFIYAGFEEVLKVVVETTYHDLGKTKRAYRAILQDERGDIHLGGGGGEVDWIDLDYGWEDALTQVESLIEHDVEEDEEATTEVVEGEERYQALRAQMN
jgi:hypothetical protein